ncbi:MAG: peptidylprolyl isomerase [Alphaproteobacteria bacterium]
MRRYTSRRKKALRNLAVVTIIVAIGFLASKLFSSKGEEQDAVVAEVGKEKILRSQINKKLESIFADEQQLVTVPQLESLPKEVLEIVVKEIIIDREIIKLAKKTGLEKDPKIIEKIANYKDRVLRQSYIDSIINKEITKEKVSEKYAEITNAISGKKEYQIAHIVVKSKEDADKIITELKSKKAPKFPDLAKKYSIEQQSAQSGGDLGFILEDNITKEIADELINLKKDEITSPIKTKFGWHIVKLNDLRDAKTLSFEESKDKIREQLIQNKISEINSTFTKNEEIKFLINFEQAKESKDDAKKSNEENAQTSEAVDSQNSEIKTDGKTDGNVSQDQKADPANKESAPTNVESSAKDSDKNKKDQNSNSSNKSEGKANDSYKNLDKANVKTKDEVKKSDSSNSKSKADDKVKAEDKANKDDKKDDKTKSDKKTKDDSKNKSSKADEKSKLKE